MKAWLPPLAWMGLIFFLSSRPMLPGTEDIPDWLTHGGAWAVLAVMLARALEASRIRHVAALAFVGATAYGVLDEIHQSYVPGRYPDPWDVIKDAVGALAGLAAWQLRLRQLLEVK